MRTRSLAFALVALLMTPLATLAAMPDKFPADTLLYISWPGSSKLGDAFRYSSMAQIMNEPEVQQLRKQLPPALDALISQQIGGGKESEVYVRAKELLEDIYAHPTAIAVVSVDPNTVIPLVNAAVIVQAGDRSASLGRTLESLLEAAEAPMDNVKTVKVGTWEMRELAVMGPAMSLRWGVIDDSLVVSFGNKVLKHLVPGYLAGSNSEPAETQPAGGDAPSGTATAPAARSLADNPLFVKAMQVTGGSTALPVVFVNIEQALHTLEGFQPMLASFGVPVVGEPGGVAKALAEFGVKDPKSFTIAWTPEAGGLQTNMFFHAPGSQGAEPLTPADLKIIPQTASWASAGQTDLQKTYDAILRLVQTVSPQKHDELMDILSEIETRLGMKIGPDVLGSFGDTWIIYDDPNNGSLLFTGVTIVADLKPQNRIDAALRAGIEILAEETDSRDKITLREQTYRGEKITYMNFSGLPVPFAPAWASYEGRWVLALYPQMVRVALDHLMDKQAKSILDNEGFANGWKLMPPNASSMNYVDAGRGVRQLYSLALPVSQVLIAMGQGEGLTMDVTALPALPTISRHVFPSVSAGTTTPEGYLVKSHGAIPGTLTSLSQASVVGPLAVSIALPALARARQQAKGTVSMSNLKQIGLAVLVYAEQNKGKLPPDLQTLVDSGAISEKALISPNDSDPGEDGSYIYVGAGLRNTMDPRLIVAYEKTENNGGGATNAVFLDGHVEYITSDRLDELLEKTKEASEAPADADEEKESKEPDDQMKKELEKEKQEESGELPKPAVIVAPRSASPGAAGPKSKEAKLARSMISHEGPISMAVDTFRLDVGRYPETLTELTEKPKDEDDAKKWNGPYVRAAEFLNDPWGKPVQYRVPGEKNGRPYDLWSMGPDGEDGTDDDIVND